MDPGEGSKGQAYRARMDPGEGSKGQAYKTGTYLGDESIRSGRQVYRAGMDPWEGSRDQAYKQGQIKRKGPGVRHTEQGRI